MGWSVGIPGVVSVGSNGANVGSNATGVDNPFGGYVNTFLDPLGLGGGGGLFGMNQRQSNQSGGISYPGFDQPSFNSALNSDVYKKMKSQATSKGLSPWAGLAESKQNMLASQGMDKAAEMASNQGAQSMNRLAATGGLTSGARERAIQEVPKNYMGAASEIAGKKNLALMDIGMEDAKNKQGLLGQTAGFEMKDIENKNQFDQNLYNQKMQAWAAKQQAQATRDAEKKEGLFGLGILGL